MLKRDVPGRVLNQAASRPLFYVPPSRGHARLGQQPPARGVSASTRQRTERDRYTSGLGENHTRLHGLVDLAERLGPTVMLVEHDGHDHETLRDGLDLARLTLIRLDGWNAGAARLFAVECAERILPLLVWHDPEDDRPSQLLAAGREMIAGGIREATQEAARRDARAYEADIAEHTCHPAILPAARACAATLQACVWGAVRIAATSAAEAEATRAAWDAAWTAARDAAWFAYTATASDAASTAAWHTAWADTFEQARDWQAGRLAQHLGVAP